MTARNIPQNPQERWEWIKYQLRIAGSSFAAIAKELGVTRQTIRRAIDVPYPKIQRAIAAKLGLSPQTIWPERYSQKFSMFLRKNQVKDRSRE